MDWLSAALWNLCMSMLPQRNARALLVPLLCLAMLVPLSQASGARRQPLSETEGLGTLSTSVDNSFAAGFAATLTTSDELSHGHMAGSIMTLAQQAHAGRPTTEPPQVLSTGYVPEPAVSPNLAYTTEPLQDGNAEQGRRRPGVRSESQNRRSLVLLGRDTAGIVPRKFTIPEPSVVADAEEKHIAMLPAKPHAAAAEEHRLSRRNMLARSGITLVDTMVVATVDGRMYGVSRFDGSIIWRRDGLLESAATFRANPTCPRGMVWTRSRADNYLDASGARNEVCAPLHGGVGRLNFSSDTAGKGASNGECPRESLDSDSGDALGELEADSDGDDEEEWLLEQGIDWRSDPQLLERQRRRRREWLDRQKSKAHRNAFSRTGGDTCKPQGMSPDSESVDPPEALYIAEPGGGGALYMYNAELGLKKLPLTIQNLVDQSPVRVSDVLYTGTKEASFAAIDLATGRLLSIYGDERLEKGGDSGEDNSSSSFTSPRFGARRASIKLLLSEKLNRVSIYPAKPGADRFRQLPQWELYHRSVQAPTLDTDIDALLSELSDAIEALGATDGGDSDSDGDGDVVVNSSPHGPTKFVMTQDGGFVMLEATTGIPLWAQEFDSPVVSVFDVFGIATADADGSGGASGSTNYVARRRDLSPAAQQSRFLRWRQLHEVDDEAASGGSRFGFGKLHSQDSQWRTGSAGGNILAGAFWERTSRTTAQPQIAYIGKLKDTLYTLTSDEFPLIDHPSLLSSLLLALAQAKRDQLRYAELQHPEWWDRWGFLTHDAAVLRVLQEARAWWLRPPATEGDLAFDNRFERIMDMVVQHHAVASKASDTDVAASGRQICDAEGHCYFDGLVGLHPFEPLLIDVPEVEGVPLHRPGLPGSEVVREGYEDASGEAVDQPHKDNAQRLADEASAAAAAALLREDNEYWPWWRYVGHYMTRVAAFIGYMVTITVLVAFAGAVYLLRPRNKRRPRMWIDAEGDDTTRNGRRARLRVSWALMHRMWDTLKEEWRYSVEEAWRNPNAAAMLRRTGVTNRSPDLDTDTALAQQELSRHSNASAGSGQDGMAQALRRGSASGSGSGSPLNLGVLGREDSDPSTIERLPSGMTTPRRNSTGALPMTPLKRGSVESDSIERMLVTSPRAAQARPARLDTITMTDQVLGYGSHGTVVYRGEFQGRAVAVKRLLVDFYEVAEHEVKVLQDSDSHPNVIRYYCTEREGHFLYIALELCTGSLADAIMRAPMATVASQLLATITKRKAMYQLACGLHHLHALKLVHRDIKPQNILIAPPPHRRRRRVARSELDDPDDSVIMTHGAPRVLISDFGLSRILDDDESSFANTYTMHGMGNGAGHMPGAMPVGMIGGIGGGTVGWRAPECFDSPEARRMLSSPSVQPQASDTLGEPPSWPSLRGQANGLADEPSPYVSRGTRSRLRHLTMTASVTAPLDTTDSAQQQQQGSEGDEPEDSAGTNPTNTTDLAASTSFARHAGSHRRMTRAVDIFSMGCVFHYVLMDGEHPFGDRLSREQRILAGTPDLRPLEGSDNPSAIEAVDLIAHMVARHERDRPSAASVLVHPYFWDATQRLGFMQDVSDCLEAEARLIKVASEGLPEPPKKPRPTPKKKGGAPSGPPPPPPPPVASTDSATDKLGSHAFSNESIENIIAQLPSEQATAVRRAITLLDAFEVGGELVMDGPPPATDGFQVVGMPPPNHALAVEAMSEAVGSGKGRPARPRKVMWDRRLDSHLRRDLGKFRKYDGTRLRDLLRVIRNKKNHYQDMAEPLREALGDIPDGYLNYFESRFPYLLLHCYYFVLEDDSLRTATVFRPYFRPPPV
ncbi:bifunctional endoribonuclease/protein kinase ire1 [Coemansia aciculifera]|uniref:non-specific serine/threonine protein kinase n=1 Tax=Coemansia aciculifera TaxID=417176 RepID=A0A9W8IKK2_9FUNG|nr:bifunctional endoribonuclease/protein kinase ire1 [Coemansia aciculifera]